MRLIDADALKVDWYDDYEMDDGDEYSYPYVSQYQIDKAPTIDAIEVVRCKDCIHQGHCHETVAHTKHNDGFIEYWSETIKWCSRGERREK